VGGVLGVLCATIGAAMATEAIKLICGVGEPLIGRVQLYDALKASWSTIPLLPNPDRPSVTALQEPDEVCAVPAAPDTISASELEAERTSARPPFNVGPDLPGPSSGSRPASPPACGCGPWRAASWPGAS